MKLLIGYGLKYSNETFEDAIGCYFEGSHIHKTKKEAREHIKQTRLEGGATKREKILIFKLFAEINNNQE